MEVNRTNLPNADKIVLTTGTLLYGGTLTVTNMGDALAGGEVFDLFDAPAFGGSFAVTNLPSIPSGMNWWFGNLNVDGSILVNRPPTAQDKVYARAKGSELKIAKADLLIGASDPDAGDSVSYDALASAGSQGATVTEDSAYIYYAPANDNPDTLQYRLRDTRGGAVTQNIQINVTNSVSMVQTLSVSGSTATVSFAGIPGYAYQVQRSTNMTDWVILVTTNAPSHGLFQWQDDFADIGGAPGQAYYRLLTP
jgi:hypothetical protein